MKKSFSIFIILMALFVNAFGAEIFEVKYKSEAEVKIAVVKYKSDADLCVYVAKYKSEATGRDDIWHYVKYKSEADTTVYFVRYKSEADIKVYFVKYKSAAGWRTSNPFRGQLRGNACSKWKSTGQNSPAVILSRKKDRKHGDSAATLQKTQKKLFCIPVGIRNFAGPGSGDIQNMN